MTKMICTRLDDGHVELKVQLALKNLGAGTLGSICEMLKDIRPFPMAYGCERVGNTDTTDCVVVLHSHTSDPGIFEAITSFSRIMSSVAPIDTIDACGLMKK